ncbi:phosphotransferase [Pectobacteriaceae bacterium CE70]|nr:phosphotransferase [Pectobacteriaceae bacterium C52]WJV68365.1 phosphotransferase [Pectobacteriaceae bacterium CE70]WJY12296.1 phosphotransferase [Pectobacteriaceae bacterium C80]
MSDPHVLFTTDVPLVSLAQAHHASRERYGVEGDITPLPGERDANFYLCTEKQHGYMLKFINPAEEPAVSDFQSALLLHIEQQHTDLPVPRVLADQHGNRAPVVDLAGQTLQTRLFSWLSGTPLHQVTPNPQLAHHLGQTLAQLDIALHSFTHPAAERTLLWDITHMERVAGWLDYVEDPEQQILIKRGLSQWENSVAPVIHKLRRQVIHNDLNPYNVFTTPQADWQITGIIDFGDALYAPLINELATALAYQISESDDPLLWITPFVSAYHTHLPLTEQEVCLLPRLIVARLTLILSITQWRSALYPENREYLRRNLHRAWRSLQNLSRFPLTQYEDRLLTTCRKGIQ